MKKGIFCFAMVILLVFSTMGTVLAADAENINENADISAENAQSVPGENGLTSPNTSELGPSTSVQLWLAMLQLQKAEVANQQALSKMEHIYKTEQEKKQVSGFLNTARQCKSDAQSTGEATEMPSDMAEYMKANELAYDTTGDDLLMTSDEWDTAIKSLESRLEELGTHSQQQLIYLQDFMGQYNSYSQGANTQISNANQTIASLARGQSMYGDSEAGLAVTGLVVGLVLGCVITLAVQKVRRKTDKA